MSLDDVNNFDEKKKNALGRVEKAHEKGKITEKDAKDIRKYGIGKGNIAPSTMKDRLGHLRIIAEESRSNTPIVEHSSFEIKEILFELQSEKDWSDGTKRNYEKSLRSFLRYHDRDEIAEDIELTKAKSPKFREESLILLDDLRDMLSEMQLVRDQAMLAIMWEGGLRLTALLSLRVRDFVPKGDEYGIIQIPHAEGVKGADENMKPITWSRGYLDQWLDEHPQSNDPSAPLFCQYKNDENSAGEPLSPQYVRGRIRRIAEKVDGMDAEKIHPHAARHGRATWMAQNGYTEREIEQNLDWTRESAQHSRYEHLLQQDKVDSILRRTGVELDEEQEEEQESVECPRCGSRVLSTAKYCPNCSLRLSAEKPPWLRVYQQAVDDSIYMNELASNPRWNIAELRPELYDEVRSVVSTALHEATIPDDIEPPDDWEWHYPDLDISKEEAEKLSKHIFGGLPWKGHREDYEELIENYPSEKEKSHYQFYRLIENLDEKLPNIPE